MSRIEAVFFDCDGTLVDSEVICSRAYVTMFQEFGITLDPEEVFKRFKGVKLNRPGFPGECFICELRLPDHRF